MGVVTCGFRCGFKMLDKGGGDDNDGYDDYEDLSGCQSIAVSCVDAGLAFGFVVQ